MNGKFSVRKTQILKWFFLFLKYWIHLLKEKNVIGNFFFPSFVQRYLIFYYHNKYLPNLPTTGSIWHKVNFWVKQSWFSF